MQKKQNKKIGKFLFKFKSIDLTDREVGEIYRDLTAEVRSYIADKDDDLNNGSIAITGSSRIRG